jgi:type III pantothenate kinase
MSILLVDIGNTRIKWARLAGDRLSRQQAAAHAGWRASQFARHVLGKARGLERIVAVSVAGARIDAQFAAAARKRAGIKVEFVTSQRRLAGVTTKYVDPWRLGTDRLVAAIGAHHMVKPRTACVVDVGTTITVDLIDRRGIHHGGAIIPAPQLMVDGLLRNTSGILKRARGASIVPALFARSTRDAIEQGTRYAAAAVIDRAVEMAKRQLRVAPRVLLTGGAAPELRQLLFSRHDFVPDLVLRGLAVIAKA